MAHLFRGRPFIYFVSEINSKEKWRERSVEDYKIVLNFKHHKIEIREQSDPKIMQYNNM